MENRQKMISLVLSAVIMIIVIVVAITIEKESDNITINESTTVLTDETEVKAYEEAQIEENSVQVETEAMTEAPTDFSNWEIHKAADNEPDTGETIPE